MCMYLREEVLILAKARGSFQYVIQVLSADALNILRKYCKHTIGMRYGPSRAGMYINMSFQQEVRYQSTEYEVPIPTSGGICSVYISEGDIIGEG